MYIKSDMGNVVIVTRDCNGKRERVYMSWDEVAMYADKQDDDTTEIQLIFVEGKCVYSGIGQVHALSWDEVSGFFA